MVGNRRFYIPLIIAIIIKDGFTKSNIVLESGFKPFFPKGIFSRTPAIVLNPVSNNNSTLEHASILENSTLNFAASTLASKATHLPPSSWAVDQHLISKRHGLLGFLPSFRPPFFMNLFGRRSLNSPPFPEGQLPLTPQEIPAYVPPFLRAFKGFHSANMKLNSSHPNQPVSNINKERPNGEVPKQPPTGPTSEQQRPHPLSIKAAPRNPVIRLQNPNASQRYPVYPASISPVEHKPLYARQRHRYQSPTIDTSVHTYAPHNSTQTTLFKPELADLTHRTRTDPGAPAYRNRMTQNSKYQEPLPRKQIYESFKPSKSNYTVTAVRVPSYALQNLSLPKANLLINAALIRTAEKPSNPIYSQMGSQPIISQMHAVKNITVNHAPLLSQQAQYNIPPQPITPDQLEKNYNPSQNSSRGISNSLSQFQIAQQLLSLSLRKPSYETPVEAFPKPSEQPRSYKVPKNLFDSLLSTTVKSTKPNSVNYTKIYKDYNTDNVEKTNSAIVTPEEPHDIPQQHIYMTIIYTNYSDQNTSFNEKDLASNVRLFDMHKVPMQRLLNNAPIKSNSPQNSPNSPQMFPFAPQQPSSEAYFFKTIIDKYLKGNAQPLNYASYKSSDTIPVPEVPLITPVYPAQNAQSEFPQIHYSLGTQTTNYSPLKYSNSAALTSNFPPNYVLVPSQRHFSHPQKQSYAAPGVHSYFPQERHYIPRQYKHLAPSYFDAQESFFPDSPETHPHAPKDAPLAPEISAKFLWGTHTFNHALQRLNLPSTHPFGGHVSSSDSHNEQFSDCGHTWMSFIAAPADMSESKNDGVTKDSTNESSRIPEISDSVARNKNAQTSISTETHGTKYIPDDLLSKPVAIVGSPDSRFHVSEPYSYQNPYGPTYGPGPYYLAPYIVTNIRVQSPENSVPQNPQIPQHFISHPSTHLKMENPNFKISVSELFDEPVVSNFRAGLVEHFNATNATNGGSKKQDQEASTAVANQSSTPQTTKVTEQIPSESFKSIENKPSFLENRVPSTSSRPTRASDALSENLKSSNSIKEITRLPFLWNKVKTTSAHPNRSTATSTRVPASKSQKETTGEPFYAQHLPT